MKQYDAFISYRRKTGFYMAKSIASWLEERGLKVFLDIDQATPGHFDERIESAIKNSKNIILLMTPDIFYESKNNVNDWIVKELKIAKKSKVEIIPVAHRDFEWPKEYHEELDEVIQDVKMCEWVMESFNYLDAMVDKICEFMKDVKYTLGGVSGINFLKNNLECVDNNVTDTVQIDMAFHTGAMYIENDEYGLLLNRMCNSNIKMRILLNDSKALPKQMLGCLAVADKKYISVNKCINFWKNVAEKSGGIIETKVISVPLFRRYYNIKSVSSQNKETGIMNLSYYTYGGMGVQIDYSKTFTNREKMYDVYDKEFKWLWEKAKEL